MQEWQKGEGKEDNAGGDQELITRKYKDESANRRAKQAGDLFDYVEDASIFGAIGLISVAG